MSDEAWRLPPDTRGRFDRIGDRLTAIERRLAMLEAKQPPPPVTYSTSGKWQQCSICGAWWSGSLHRCVRVSAPGQPAMFCIEMQ